MEKAENKYITEIGVSALSTIKMLSISKTTTDPLSKCVQRSLKRYFRDLNGEKPTNIYSMVMEEIEKPLLEVVMEEAKSNQTEAARLLGINRNTLRKKLKHYHID